MATDFGIDVVATTDLDRYFNLVTGTQVVGQAIARRVQTPQGSLPDDPDYGYDLRQWVHVGMGSSDIFQAEALTEAQCLQDERVNEVDVTITQDGEALTVTILVTLFNDVVFDLVLAIGSVTVEILQGA